MLWAGTGVWGGRFDEFGPRKRGGFCGIPWIDCVFNGSSEMSLYISSSSGSGEGKANGSRVFWEESIPAEATESEFVGGVRKN